MRRLLVLAATLTAVTLPSGTEPAATESTAITQESPTLRSTAAQRDAVSITLYNQNFGLVREIRTPDLTSGRVALEYGDVASGIHPETVHIRPLGSGGLQVFEQNYQFDLLNPQKLLEKYVSRTVNVYRTNPQTGVDEAVEAEVLSVNGSPILRIGGEITFNYPGRFGFLEVPDNLIAEPTLLWRLDATGGQQQVEVSYLTNSLNWKSDYVVVLNEDDQWLSATRFDVVLLDVELPRMDGVEFLAWALARDPELAVIMLTGLDNPNLALGCLSKGARTYFVKPFDPSFIRHALRDAVAMRRLLVERNEHAEPSERTDRPPPPT